MSIPLTVKVSRDGKEIGEYSVPDALRLLAEGTLRGTDHYWQQGMTDWALLSGLKAKEEVRIKNELETKARNEKGQAAENAQREKAEVARIQSEAARIQSEKKKANNFHCHCCRESFPRPYDPTQDFRPATWSFFLNSLWLIIPIIGWVLGPVGMWRATIRMLASGLHLPSCPTCRSANFARPERDSSFDPLLPIGVSPDLYRSSDQFVLAGVCGGLAHWTGFNPIIVRLAFCLGCTLGIIIYIIMWIACPKRPTKRV
jgi:phage shock protein PspC (stress-responsive transcriptional regulator)